jgi:hypothetical protein
VGDKYKYKEELVHGQGRFLLSTSPRENMKIKLLVELSANGGGDGLAEEEIIRPLIKPTIKNTKFQLGSAVISDGVSLSTSPGV